jgi:hypothetical protein
MPGKHSLEAELVAALQATARDIWNQERKLATTAEELAEADRRRSSDLATIEDEAEQLADTLTEDRLRARITRERHAKITASVFRIRNMLKQVDEMMDNRHDDPNPPSNG